MTIVAAWVRKTKKGAEELLMVSDSRLNGGGNLDSVPKLFLLPRTDCVIGFSGTTLIAYPLLTQISQSINSHHPLRNRVIDYIPLRTHIVKVINELFGSYDTYLDDLKNPDTSFLLGGYSWFKKEFQIDQIHFNSGLNKFEYKSCGMNASGYKSAFIGDWAKRAKLRYTQKVRDTKPQSLHLEPFEVIRDLLRESRRNYSIGGAPQIVSVSQHMNSSYTAVYWPDRASGNIYLGGRKLLGFENIEAWILDPDTLIKEHPHFTADESKHSRK